MSKARKPWFVGVGLVMAVLAVLWLIQVGFVLADAKRAGLLDEEKTVKYQVSRDNNLKAIHKALIQAAESDGGFPEAKKWMDTAWIRLKTGDLSEAEAKDKLRVPGLASGVYGYAFNSALSGKHPDDFKGKTETIMVYESKQEIWNGCGDPAKDAMVDGKAITLAGDVVKLGG